MGLSLLAPKITRKLDKQKEIGQMIDCLQQTDWRGINTKFAAVDLEKICKVSSGIGDELQFCMEISELRNKFETLVSDVEGINKLTEVVTRASENIQNRHMMKNNEKNLYPSVVSRDVRKTQNRGYQRPPSSPPLSQKVALGEHNLLGISLEEEIPHNSTLKNDGFTIVKRKKRKSNITQENAPSNYIKSVPRSRTGILFATRFDPETKPEDVAKMVDQNELINHPLLKAEELTTKHNSYKSFKLDFDLKELPLSQFFPDMEDPKKWAEGLLVRPFKLVRTPPKVIIDNESTKNSKISS